MRKIMLLASLGLLVAPAAWGIVPNTMNVQGRLLNAGSPMSGNHPATFKIYDAATGGALLWTEDNTLDVLNGVYSAILGQTTPLPTLLFSNQPRWLEVTVEGTTLSPRLGLTTSAYAFWAQHADTANFALNAPSAGDNLWSTDGTNVWRASGSIGLGTSTPDSPLDIRGNSQFSANGASPDTKAYAPLGITRTADPGNLSYLGFTKQATLPWGFGIDGSDRLIIGLNAASPTQTIPNPLIYVHPYTGNVGIGTTPTVKLDVAGDLAATNGAFSSNVVVSTTGFSNTVFSSGLQFARTTDLPNYQASIQYHYNYNNAFGIYTWGDNRQIFGASADGGNIFFPTGNVSIAGNLTVAGTKCRVVTTTYGKLKMNAVESGHALFMDDEPSARLVNGRCRINLSSRFMATVTVNGRYPLAVNVTFYEPHGEWYVQRDATGFTVIDPSGSNAEFSWQAIARQKGYEETNLEPVDSQTAAK